MPTLPEWQEQFNDYQRQVQYYRSMARDLSLETNMPPTTPTRRSSAAATSAAVAAMEVPPIPVPIIPYPLIPATVTLPRTYSECDELFNANNPEFCINSRSQMLGNQRMKLADDLWMARSSRPTSISPSGSPGKLVTLNYQGITCVVFTEAGWLFLNSEGIHYLHPLFDILRRCVETPALSLVAQSSDWEANYSGTWTIRKYSIDGNNARSSLEPIASYDYADYMAIHPASGTVHRNPVASVSSGAASPG